MRRIAEFAAVFVLDLLGAAGALLAATRTWQVVRVRQPPPLPDEVLSVSGRTVDAAVTALAVVALAGVVALLATRGVARRIVGVVVALVGVGMIWRAALATAAIGATRARALVREHHPGVSLVGAAAPHVSTSAIWAALTIACGALVTFAGAWAGLRGNRWSTMSARYESRAAAADPDAARARAATSMWNALDRGDDPTTGLRDDQDATRGPHGHGRSGDD
jgi:uncharacterized membrane protein (TIGR02234 family)